MRLQLQHIEGALKTFPHSAGQCCGMRDVTHRCSELKKVKQTGRSERVLLSADVVLARLLGREREGKQLLG
jgi:hypothetical protein